MVMSPLSGCFGTPSRITRRLLVVTCSSMTHNSRWFASGKARRIPPTTRKKRNEVSVGQQPKIGSGPEQQQHQQQQHRDAGMQSGLLSDTIVKIQRFNIMLTTPLFTEKVYAFVSRLPLAAILLGLLYWEETRPFGPATFTGPSMLPTIAADSSEVWMVWSPWLMRLRRLPGRLLFGNHPFPYRKGDIVAFSSPDHRNHVACKRIIGLPGDTVASYGQYVQLFIKQDPLELGRTWPDELHPHYELAMARRRQQQQQDLHHRGGDGDDADHDKPILNPFRTEVVPEGHVWLESDCPGLGLDSRQYGPIPQSWIRGVVMARVWPFGRLTLSKRKRPQPIALDDKTLRTYNLHRVEQQRTS